MRKSESQGARANGYQMRWLPVHLSTIAGKEEVMKREEGGEEARSVRAGCDMPALTETRPGPTPTYTNLYNTHANRR